MKSHDRSLLLVVKPVIAGHPGVVFVHATNRWRQSWNLLLAMPIQAMKRCWGKSVLSDRAIKSTTASGVVGTQRPLRSPQALF